MSQTTREERRSALDEFAQAAKQETIQMPAVIQHQPPTHMMHGPQPVARLRDESQILIKLKTLAAAAGTEWFYRIPFRDKKAGKTTYVEGPSIKLANDLARIYGACDVDSWVSGEGVDYWEITARFIDLESGFSITRPFRQRKGASRIGGGDEARNAEAAFNIGVSKAERNIVTNALQTFADFAFDEARNALVDKIGKDLEHFRAVTTERLASMVALDRVEAVIGRAAKDWLAPDIARVIAMGKAIQDGMATVDETFPPLGRDLKHDAVTADLDAFAKGSVLEQEAGANDAPNRGAGSAQGSGEISPPIPPSDPVAASFRRSVEFEEAKAEAIDKILALASDSDLDEQQRLESIDQVQPIWEDKLDGAFCRELFITSAKVAKGALKPDAARRYLTGL